MTADRPEDAVTDTPPAPVPEGRVPDEPADPAPTATPDDDAPPAAPPRLSLLVLPGDEEDRERTDASVEAQGDGPWEVLEATEAQEARGDWVGILAAGDTLEPAALPTMLAALDAAEGVRVVYADERLPDGRTHAKPSWMPRALDHLDVLGRLTLVRADLLAEVGGPGDLGTDPAAEWDLHLRLAEHLGAGDPAAPSPDVLHLPFTALARAQDPAKLLPAGAAAVGRSLTRRGLTWTVAEEHGPDHLRIVREPARTPLVSVVVPTGGGRRPTPDGEVSSVDVALTTLLDVTDYPDLEVVVVTSQGTDPEVAERCAALDPRVRVVTAEGPFSFSRSINVGVAHARGELVLLLNDDTEVVDPTWLRNLVAVALEEGVGAVGARLLYGDGTIQHAGIVMSADRTPSHLLAHEPDGVARLGVGTADLEFLAVTAACLLTPRATFEQVGGLTEELPLSYNDVDYCLKLRAVGLRTVCAAGVRVVHHESVTRDARVTDREHAAVSWWSGMTALDPWYWGV